MIRGITNFLIKRFIKNHSQVDDPNVRSQYGMLEGWLSILVNSMLFGIKLSLGIMYASISLITDAAHTFLDSGTSLVIIIGFHLAKKPPDSQHPFGHGRMENITALIVSILVILTGIEFLRTSFEYILSPEIQKVSWVAMLIIFVTILLKEIMAQISRELGKRIHSIALEADFWHHRSDVIATSLVLAALILTRFEIHFVDGIAGVLVAIIIILAGIKLTKDTISPLLGESADETLVQKITTIAQNFSEVQGVHDVIIHDYGRRKMASIHVEISDQMELMQSHELSEAVETVLKSELGLEDVIVHVDPINREFEEYTKIEQVLDSIVTDNLDTESTHDLRVIGSTNRVNVICDIVLIAFYNAKQITGIKEKLQEKFYQHFPNYKLIIKFDNKYSGGFDNEK